MAWIAAHVYRVVHRSVQVYRENIAGDIDLSHVCPLLLIAAVRTSSQGAAQSTMYENGEMLGCCFMVSCWVLVWRKRPYGHGLQRVAVELLAL